MRKAFINTLVEIAKQDERVVLLTADLGYLVIESFAHEFPSRFFNVGVAEQNMIGIATGLAKIGFIPFVYSMIPFVIFRPYEFIRNGPIFHHLPVKIIGVGAGLEYGYNGMTHYGIEDVSVMRLYENLNIVVPVDYKQVRCAMLSTWNLPGPTYYRLGKDETYEVPELDGKFELGRVQVIRRGEDVILITMGSIIQEVIRASETLAVRGIKSTIVIVNSFNPSPVNDIINLISKFKIAITIEEHCITGGLGSFVSEVVAENSLSCRIIRCGIKNKMPFIVGELSYLRHSHGLSNRALAETIFRALEKFGSQKEDQNAEKEI